MNKTSITISTFQKHEIINITNQVESWLNDIRAKNGLLYIFVPHATAALILNEDEKGLKNDFISFSKMIDLLGAQTGGFQHNRIDKNASAHILSSILGTQKILPVENGQLIRGTWQEILFLELDGPRTNRKIHLILISNN